MYNDWEGCIDSVEGLSIEAKKQIEILIEIAAKNEVEYAPKRKQKSNAGSISKANLMSKRLGERSHRCARVWNEMSDEMRHPFENMAMTRGVLNGNGKVINKRIHYG